LINADDSIAQAGDGSRQPTEKELTLASEHGKQFYQAVSKVNFA
jgi:NAD(P)H dehydrogenase (quinone)